MCLKDRRRKDGDKGIKMLRRKKDKDMALPENYDEGVENLIKELEELEELEANGYKSLEDQFTDDYPYDDDDDDAADYSIDDLVDELDDIMTKEERRRARRLVRGSGRPKESKNKPKKIIEEKKESKKSKEADINDQLKKARSKIKNPLNRLEI